MNQEDTMDRTKRPITRVLTEGIILSLSLLLACQAEELPSEAARGEMVVAPSLEAPSEAAPDCDETRNIIYQVSRDFQEAHTACRTHRDCEIAYIDTSCYSIEVGAIAVEALEDLGALGQELDEQYCTERYVEACGAIGAVGPFVAYCEGGQCVLGAHIPCERDEECQQGWEFCQEGICDSCYFLCDQCKPGEEVLERNGCSCSCL